MDARERRLREYERGFRRAGLPLLIEEFSAREDVFNRPGPILLLAVVFAAEVASASDVDWPLLANVAVVVGVVALLAGAFALVNRLRGRRPFATPERVGTVELTAFVLLPPIVQGVFHGGWGVVVLGVNLALLALVALVWSFGLGAIVVWAARRLSDQLARSLLLLARAVPLLLIFALVLFINTEMWQVFSDRSDATLVATGLLLALVAFGFLLARLPKEVAALEADVLDPDGAGPGAPAKPLTRRQRANVGLVLLISHGLQIAVVTLAIGAFFVAFGMIAIDTEVMRAWTGDAGERIVSLTVLDVPLRLTVELLRVAGVIAAVSGLYYAISVLTDSAYRDEFLDEVTVQMRATFAARADYLALRATGPAH